TNKLYWIPLSNAFRWISAFISLPVLFPIRGKELLVVLLMVYSTCVLSLNCKTPRPSSLAIEDDFFDKLGFISSTSSSTDEIETDKLALPALNVVSVSSPQEYRAITNRRTVNR